MAFDSSGQILVQAGSPGRGPGEVAIALGFDVAPDGVVWIADPGNAKILGFRDSILVTEFLVQHQPLGIATPDTVSVWVGGDLRTSVMVRYDRQGRVLGTAGVPLGKTPSSFRFNQGIPASGSGPCAVVWAYTFHSVLECYAADGRTVWTAHGPVAIAPPKDADPRGMSPTDRFAYVDLTASGNRLYALFIGGPPGLDGLRSQEVHEFDVHSGQYLGRLTLPIPAKFIHRQGTVLMTLDYDPLPVVRIYRVAEGE